MSLRQKAVRGVFWSAVQNWGSNLIVVTVVVLLARLLQPEAFGLVAEAQVFVAFATIFQKQGFVQALVQRSDLERGHMNTAFWASVGAGVLLTIVGVAGAGVVAMFFHEPQLVPVVRWLSLSFLISGLASVPQALLQRELAFKGLAVRALAAAVAGGAVGVGMALAGFGVWSLVGQVLAGGFAGTVVLWIGCKWRPGVAVSARHFKDLFSFGVHAMGSELCRFVSYRADHVLIGFLLGPVALGYYNVACQIVEMVTRLLTQTISAVAFPTFSRLQDAPEQMRHAFYTATRMSSLVALPAFLGIIALAPELVAGVMGPQWEQCTGVMQAMASLGILRAVLYFNGAVIMAYGKPSWVLGLGLMSALSSIAILLVAVRWGIVVVAAALAVRGYLLSPIGLWAVHKLIRFDPGRYIRQYVAPLVSALVMVAFVWGGKYCLAGMLGLHVLLPLCILMGVAVYALTVFLVAPTLLWQMMDLLKLAVPVGRPAGRRSAPSTGEG